MGLSHQRRLPPTQSWTFEQVAFTPAPRKCCVSRALFSRPTACAIDLFRIRKAGASEDICSLADQVYTKPELRCEGTLLGTSQLCHIDICRQAGLPTVLLLLCTLSVPGNNVALQWTGRYKVLCHFACCNFLVLIRLSRLRQFIRQMRRCAFHSYSGSCCLCQTEELHKLLARRAFESDTA